MAAINESWVATAGGRRWQEGNARRWRLACLPACLLPGTDRLLPPALLARQGFPAHLGDNGRQTRSPQSGNVSAGELGASRLRGRLTANAS